MRKGQAQPFKPVSANRRTGASLKLAAVLDFASDGRLAALAEVTIASAGAQGSHCQHQAKNYAVILV